MLTITESAQGYLRELLSNQDDDVIGIRVFINQPGTPKAETCIAYCRQDDVKENDEIREMDDLQAWLDGRSLPFLEDGLIDYSKDRMGGQLTIKAPNSKMPKVNDDSPLEDRVNYILYNEVNPSLSLRPIIFCNNSMILLYHPRYGTTVCALRRNNGLLRLAWIPRQLQGAQQPLL